MRDWWMTVFYANFRRFVWHEKTALFKAAFPNPKFTANRQMAIFFHTGFQEYLFTKTMIVKMEEVENGYQYYILIFCLFIFSSFFLYCFKFCGIKNIVLFFVIYYSILNNFIIRSLLHLKDIFRFLENLVFWKI